MRLDIYIFTCNNSIKLENMLLQFEMINNKLYIHIIDDSFLISQIKNNKLLAEKYHCHYLGKDEFSQFYKINNKHVKNRYFLGAKKWNLGIARNFALDYSKKFCYDKVLFIDDDISNINNDKIKQGFDMLNGNNFVSCRIEGVADRSIVEYIQYKLNIIDNEPRMLSGGFLFLSPQSIKHRFVNMYNEDWIIQILEKKINRILLDFSVNHDIYNAKKWNSDNIYFQELGEIVVKGLFLNKNGISLGSKFWTMVINERINFITNLKNVATISKCYKEEEVLKNLIFWLQELDCNVILTKLKEIQNE